MENVIKYRREFHKYPETGWNEVRTSARVAELLESAGVPTVLTGRDVLDVDMLKFPVDVSEEKRRANMARAIEQGAKAEYVARTEGYPGVIGIIDTGKPGHTYALRFDMDCLPYDEVAEAGFRSYDEGYISVNGGCVHACGHDAHTAIGLALAEEIMAEKDKYSGVIKLIFQPSEEVTLGALSIVSKGHLDGVDRFLSVHLALSAENQPLPSNTIACGVKDFMSCRQLDVTFHGKAAHPCGAAQEGKNALLAACSAALNLHCIAPHEKGLCRVNVGQIYGGVCSNTIAPECTIRLEYRGQYRVASDYMGKRVFQILDGTAAAYDLSYTCVDHGEVPAGQSDTEMMSIVEKAAKDVPWFEKIYFEGNLGGTDDAAAMMNAVQAQGGIASYIGIGTDTTEPLHNPKFDFDESCMEAAVRLLALIMQEDN